jgi:hypothetical protein
MLPVTTAYTPALPVALSAASQAQPQAPVANLPTEEDTLALSHQRSGGGKHWGVGILSALVVGGGAWMARIPQNMAHGWRYQNLPSETLVTIINKAGETSKSNIEKILASKDLSYALLPLQAHLERIKTDQGLPFIKKGSRKIVIDNRDSIGTIKTAQECIKENFKIPNDLVRTSDQNQPGIIPDTCEVGLSDGTVIPPSSVVSLNTVARESKDGKKYTGLQGMVNLGDSSGSRAYGAYGVFDSDKKGTDTGVVYLIQRNGVWEILFKEGALTTPEREQAKAEAKALKDKAEAAKAKTGESDSTGGGDAAKTDSTPTPSPPAGGDGDATNGGAKPFSSPPMVPASKPPSQQPKKTSGDAGGSGPGGPTSKPKPSPTASRSAVELEKLNPDVEQTIIINGKSKKEPRTRLKRSFPDVATIVESLRKNPLTNKVTYEHPEALPEGAKAFTIKGKKGIFYWINGKQYRAVQQGSKLVIYDLTPKAN